MSTSLELAEQDAILVAHPILSQAHAQLSRMCERRHSSEHLEGSCVLIHGPSQSGKTTICRSFAQSRNAGLTAKDRRLPVVHLITPPRVTRKGLLQDILIRLNEYGYYTAATSGTESVLLDRVCKSLKNLNTELLILDECHHLKRGDREDYAADVGETIKSILLRGTCSVAMAGVGPAAEAPFIFNEQLALRAERKICLDPLRADHSSEKTIFVEFLIEYLRALKKRGVIENAEAVANQEAAYAIHQVCGGLLGRICRLLDHAVTEMRGRGDTGLSVEDLAMASDILLQHAGQLSNPFRNETWG
jgi:hypothetical protein